MADIFISYSQKDRAWVKRLVDALTAEGYEVWWDIKIRAGESFDELIERTLEKVSCVVGIWSQNSVKSKWVRAESAWAMDRGKFVSIRVDNDPKLPLKFYHVHTANLADWDDSRDAVAFRNLVEDIQEIAGPPKPEPCDLGFDITTAGEQIPRSSFRDTLRDGGVGPQMTVIPAGPFWMGSPTEDPKGNARERPRHEVVIRQRFALGKTPVSFREYDHFAEVTGGNWPQDYGWGRDDRPVIGVSWNDAVAYANWLCDQTGKDYRLPSEAEWEYACRARSYDSYCYGNDTRRLSKYAWFNAGPLGRTIQFGLLTQIGLIAENIDSTYPAGGRSANDWGLYDMHGNVWEWVQDCWHSNYKGAPTDGSAWVEGPGGDCSLRVVRGGSWLNFPKDLRSAARNRYSSDTRNSTIGFRLAQDL